MKVSLPKTLEHKVNSIHAISTKKFGPPLWKSLFFMILGSYPSQINIQNKEHIKIKKAFINTFYYLRYTLPCSFCRNSYKQFYKELPIEPYTDSKVSMLYWLYLLKDKVNKKLIKQELDFYTELYTKYKNKKITKEVYTKTSKSCFKTIPSPPFEEVLKDLIEYKGKCSKIMKKCV